jgi:hypothetical protein
MTAPITFVLPALRLNAVTLARPSKLAHQVVHQQQEEGKNEYPGDADQIIRLHDAYSVTPHV